MVADTNGGPGPGGAEAGARPDESGLNDQYVDLVQLAANRASQLADALVAGIQARPLVAAAVIAGGVGALVGLSLARRSRSPQAKLGKALKDQARVAEKQAEAARKGGQRLRKVTDYGELVPLAMKLLENPIVRAFIVQTVTKRLVRRFK